MTSKKIIQRLISSLEYDLQHYTMADKNLIEFELKEFNTILQDLERLEEENKNLKQAIEILKNYLMLGVSIDINGEYRLDANDYAIPHLEREEYELLKEVLGNENN